MQTLNPDATKKSQIWEDLRYAVKDAGQRGTTVSPSLTTTKTGKLNTSQVEIEVLAPAPALILGGAGGKDLRGRKLTSNSISAVIGLVHHSHRIAILGGDIDTIGWDNLIQDNTDLQADILVFPHHGGKSGGGTNERAFARQWCELIKPNLVIFSIGRQPFAHPREEIVAGVRDGDPSPHIWCTQLAKKCAQKILSVQPQHLNPLPAKGRQKNSCCGGTLAIKINGNKTDYTNQINEHRTFIKQQIPTPLCQL